MQYGQEEGDGFSQGALPEALGVSEAFFEFQQQLSRVAKIERPVLIIGERGTGKELAASRLHYLSQRWQGPLVALNCSALAESVLESELFGHEAGAFTGAVKRRMGRFEAAQGGTLFLDEIGLLSTTVQEKILRAVEYGVFQRVGGSGSVKVDVRIVGATNADLPALAAAGRFKRDLLDRLSFDVLYLPPLRSRPEDIGFLARHFATSMGQELKLEGVPEFTERALASLEAYDWPGNVRELKNVVERSVYRTGSLRIDRIEFNPFDSPYGDRLERPGMGARQVGEFAGVGAADLGVAGDSGARVVGEGKLDLGRPLPELVRELELKALRQALLESGYRQAEAAKRLGLSYHQFRSLYRKYDGGKGGGVGGEKD